MVLRHGTASGHGKVVEILANVMVLLSRLTRLYEFKFKGCAILAQTFRNNMV